MEYETNINEKILQSPIKPKEEPTVTQLQTPLRFKRQQNKHQNVQKNGSLSSMNFLNLQKRPPSQKMLRNKVKNTSKRVAHYVGPLASKKLSSLWGENDNEIERDKDDIESNDDTNYNDDNNDKENTSQSSSEDSDSKHKDISSSLENPKEWENYAVGVLLTVLERMIERIQKRSIWQKMNNKLNTNKKYNEDKKQQSWDEQCKSIYILQTDYKKICKNAGIDTRVSALVDAVFYQQDTVKEFGEEQVIIPLSFEENIELENILNKNDTKVIGKRIELSEMNNDANNNNNSLKYTSPLNDIPMDEQNRIRQRNTVSSQKQKKKEQIESDKIAVSNFRRFLQNFWKSDDFKQEDKSSQDNVVQKDTEQQDELVDLTQVLRSKVCRKCVIYIYIL